VAELDTGTEDLRARVTDDGVAVLTMNRPERRNALSPEMTAALAATLAAVERDDAVGAVVLTGAGTAFCAGGDVKRFAAGDGGVHGGFEARLSQQRAAHRSTALRLWEMAKPTVAIVNGAAAGAGLSLALACDLRYAADSAVFTTAFAKVGLAGDFGGSWFLTRLVGPAKARELYFFADRVSAAEAERIGMVNAVLPAAELADAAMAKVTALARGPRIALRYMKENLNRAMTHDLVDCLDAEAVPHLRAFDTEDHKEAAAAFVAKREPRFVGR
jgi:2-(1,2-epoxy-1,2-dihydrophenyl)acetyl-CoA isomerase